MSSLSRAELRFVFLHELVHLKRCDVLAEWLLTVLQVGQWFNPLVWVAAGRCRADREVACDAAVLALSGESARADYGHTILRLAAEIPFRPRAVTAGVGILEHHLPLERRLRMIANAPTTGFSRRLAFLVAGAVGAIVVVTNAQSPKPAQVEKGANPPAAAPAPDSPAPKPRGWPGAQSAAPVEEVKVDSAAERRKAERNEGTAALLDKQIPQVQFDGTPLSEVIDFLRDATGANIFVNWRALENEGVRKDTPVTARFRQITAGKAIRVLLDNAGGAKAELGYTIDDGVVTVSTVEDLERDTETRVYDVRDLIVPIPDYPFEEFDAIGVDDKPAAAKDDKGRTREQLTEEVMKLIRETIEPKAWDKTCRMHELQGQLIVTAPKRVHEPVALLLGQLRDTRAVQVSVEAKFVTVDDAVLAALPAGLRATVEGQLRGARDPVVTDKADARPSAAPAGEPTDATKAVFLTGELADALLRAVRASPQSTLISAPRLTLFNGQSAYVLTATQRAYVADLVTVREKDGSTRYEPKLATAQAGVMLWTRATVSADRKFATLSLRPRLTQLAGLDTVPWERNPPGENQVVQRPKVLASELVTTVNVPDGNTVLLGGLKGYFPPGGAAPDAKAVGAPGAEGKLSHVIVLVKPTVIVRREVEDKRFPLLNQR
jgi:hypothetical protein